MKKFRCCILSLLLLTSVCLGSACGDSLKKEDVPDYSGYTDSFDYFGYHSVHNGYYYIDDAQFSVGESFLTTEQYQMYKDVGMTIFYPQSILKIDVKNIAGGREAAWEVAKAEIDKFVSVGIDRTILYDEDLSWLGLKPGGLVGEGKDYETEAELDQKVYELVSLYAGYPGVYGVALADEPKDIWATSYGEVYKSILRVNERCGWYLFPSYNLNPLNLSKTVYEEYYPYVEGTGDVSPITGQASFEDGFKRYQQYIINFLDYMNPSYIRYDDYPLRNGYVSPTYFPCMKFIAEIAKERGIEFHMVTQTFDMYSNGSHSLRTLDENSLKWLNNTLLGFGVKQISYFTYYTNSENRSDGESFIDNASFVDLYGNPTPIYYMMKKIMADNQTFAPTYMQFAYQKSGVFTHLPMNYPSGHIQNLEANVVTFDKVKSVSVNKECAMVNELYDKANDRYMYMAMNIVDPIHKGSTVYETITLEFSPEYKYALVYRDGESGVYKLKDNKLVVKCAPGEASFAIPFN